MIPVLREIVEFMILKKYIKLLFATESFAIGLRIGVSPEAFWSVRRGGEDELQGGRPEARLLRAEPR